MKPSIRSWICSAVFPLPFIASLGAAEAQSQTPVADVKVSGITTIFGDKRVLLVVQEPAQPGQTNGLQYTCTLKEGESSGFVTILRVDEKSERVKILNGEVEMDLTLARNGVALPASSTSPNQYAMSYSAPRVPSQPLIHYETPQYTPSQLIVVGRSCGSSYIPTYSRLSSFGSYGYRSYGYGSIGYTRSYYNSYSAPRVVTSCRVSMPVCSTTVSTCAPRTYGYRSHRR